MKSRIAFCQACSNIEFGVKTRIAVEHTCGKSSAEINMLMSQSKSKHKFQMPSKKIDPIKPHK